MNLRFTDRAFDADIDTLMELTLLIYLAVNEIDYGCSPFFHVCWYTHVEKSLGCRLPTRNPTLRFTSIGLSRPPRSDYFLVHVKYFVYLVDLRNTIQVLYFSNGRYKITHGCASSVNRS
jgi:hypothetical protein